MSDSIEDRIKKIVADQLEVDSSEVTLEASFADDLGADSLSQTELVMALEDEFNAEIPDVDAENIKTVQHAVDYITKNCS